MLYANDKNSSTLREWAVLQIAGCKPRTSKIGYNGYKGTVPYEVKPRKLSMVVDKVVYDAAIDRKDEAEYQSEQIAVLNELYRVTKAGGSLFYNHKIRWVRGRLIHPYEWVSKSRWILRQEIIWHRKIAANLRGWRFWQVDERIYWLYKPPFWEPTELGAPSSLVAGLSCHMLASLISLRWGRNSVEGAA